MAAKQVKTERPYIICHMMGSVDGRIQSKRWPLKNASRIFEDNGEKIKSDGWIVGRKTMSEFSSKKPRRPRTGVFKVPKTDFVAPHEQKTYAVALDFSGKLSWDSGHVDTEHVISVLSERVPSEYLDYLKSRGVSYIFGGRNALDLHRVVHKLYKLFGIRRIMVQGGGGNNGSFLKAGLVDELSLLLVPIADGSMQTPTVFDAVDADARSVARHLTIKSLKRLPDDVIWLRYMVEN